VNAVSEAPIRLLLANTTARRVAGTEIYLEDLAAELGLRGVPVALLAERDIPVERGRIELPPGAPVLFGLEEAATWNPTAVLVNGRLDAIWEEEILARWPSAFFIHNYYGVCISGFKRHTHPKPEPCFRRLGPACLGLYLPRGCGGKNPFTMFQLYNRELAHQKRLRRYRLLLTHSEAMRDEYLRHDFPPERVAVLPFACLRDANNWPDPLAPAGARDWEGGPARILFAGRLESIKGGAELIDAVAQWIRRHGRPAVLTIAGDGEQRELWRSLARDATGAQAGLLVNFPGWLDGETLALAYQENHVFAMPSLWPEPFGKGGMEAARFGCPSIGFAIGGIPQWLQEGVSGHLADWRGDASANLALALERTFASPEHYLALRRGAQRQARKFTSAAHCETLLPRIAGLTSGKLP